jgi:hypothetical protein
MNDIKSTIWKEHNEATKQWELSSTLPKKEKLSPGSSHFQKT